MCPRPPPPPTDTTRRSRDGRDTARLSHVQPAPPHPRVLRGRLSQTTVPRPATVLRCRVPAAPSPRRTARHRPLVSRPRPLSLCASYPHRSFPVRAPSPPSTCRDAALPRARTSLFLPSPSLRHSRHPHCRLRTSPVLPCTNAIVAASDFSAATLASRTPSLPASLPALPPSFDSRPTLLPALRGLASAEASTHGRDNGFHDEVSGETALRH
ncbi:uncharacterized protein C8Q71DRAFT_789822 [Rhodofomes roseus]|uniref:Uncharacterized protein n=1 Tax=Rhodofomes roseus TaxID=34475 RepID=A0ABQ8JZL5_9APHY|nr:uncharacterized protein C8Q71DRAFT_789822 [Rhodofomes roseus]KAH9829549.1 hypothetical protein C8Q71DRAFT_789822 [Rhodofomes roseus]